MGDDGEGAGVEGHVVKVDRRGDPPVVSDRAVAVFLEERRIYVDIDAEAVVGVVVEHPGKGHRTSTGSTRCRTRM